jgi:hypothetical protein
MEKHMKIISVKDFAEQRGISLRTAFTWLREGLVPGAEREDLPNGSAYWKIPASAIGMEKPKQAGRKPTAKKAKKSSKG